MQTKYKKLYGEFKVDTATLNSMKISLSRQTVHFIVNIDNKNNI